VVGTVTDRNRKLRFFRYRENRNRGFPILLDSRFTLN